MLFITGSSPKQQVLGHRNEVCHACKQETSHRLQRHYAVKHLFWFPPRPPTRGAATAAADHDLPAPARR